MDSRDGVSEQPNLYTGAEWSLDLAQDKDFEKNTTYAHHLEFIFCLSWRKGEKWTTAQCNVTVSIRGSGIEEAWEDQLKRLGVDQKKTRAVIQWQAIRKTLEVSDVILQ